jgi:hypothetical protein
MTKSSVNTVFQNFQEQYYLIAEAFENTEEGTLTK